MKQTAVDWLVDNLKPIYPNIEDYKLLIGLAKDIEKKQIVDASCEFMGTNFDPNRGRAQMYYEETYLKEKI